MAYATATYYKGAYYGNEIPCDTPEERAELERLLARASEHIDDATWNRSRNFSQLSEYEQEMIRKATCAEAEAIYENGDDSISGSISSYSIGDVSISLGGSGDGSNNSLNLLSEKSAKYLKNTRLASRILG